MTVAQKLEAIQHYEANPGMSFPKLVDWCYRHFDMKKKLSASTVSSWFSDAGKRSQKGKIKQAIASEINASKLSSKSFQGTHFPDLEHELFAWVRRCESRKACLTDDIIQA